MNQSDEAKTGKGDLGIGGPKAGEPTKRTSPWECSRAKTRLPVVSLLSQTREGMLKSLMAQLDP